MDLMEFSTTGLLGDNIRYNEDVSKYDSRETGGNLFGLFIFKKKELEYEK